MKFRLTSNFNFSIAIFVFSLMPFVNPVRGDGPILVVDPSWHQNTVPDIVLEDSATVFERHQKVLQLEESCQFTGDLPLHPSRACEQKLDQYFTATPIWRAASVHLYNGTRAISNYSPFDSRATILPYDEMDTMQTDVPLWGDIFDENEQDRLRIVGSVFADNACLELRELGHIQSSYSDRCEARELFKYARYLEACVTGFSRSSFLNSVSNREQLTRFERARKSIDTSTVINDSRGNGWQLVENYLLSIWVLRRCKEHHFLAVDPSIDGSSQPKQATQVVDDIEHQLRPMYDASMAIAARSGDSWAIQGYHERKMRGDIDYWRSVHELNPILFHRWMSTSIGGRWYTKDERLLHARMAYELSMQFLPSLEKTAFETYVRGRLGHFTDANLQFAQRIVDKGELEIELVHPWERVPPAFKEIQRNLRRHKSTTQ